MRFWLHYFKWTLKTNKTKQNTTPYSQFGIVLQFAPFYFTFNLHFTCFKLTLLCCAQHVQNQRNPPRINMIHMSLHPPLFLVLETCKPLRLNSLPQSPFRVCSAQAVPGGAAISQTAAHLIHVDSLHLAQFLPAVYNGSVWALWFVCPWRTQREAHSVSADRCLTSCGLMW